MGSKNWGILVHNFLIFKKKRIFEREKILRNRNKQVDRYERIKNEGHLKLTIHGIALYMRGYIVNVFIHQYQLQPTPCI